MKRLSTILALAVVAIAIVGCGEKGADDLDVKDIETDTSASAPVERPGAGAANLGEAEVTVPAGSEEAAAARMGSGLDNK